MAFLISNEKRQFIMRNNNLLRILYNTGNWLLDLILPPKCLNCSARVDMAHNICPKCWKDLYFISDPMCGCCGFPFVFQTDEINCNSLCGQCQTTKRSFDKAITALRYDDISRKMIIGFKHQDRTEYAVFFAKLLKQVGKNILKKVDIIIPVPLHNRRLLKRRYNQSALIAAILAKECDISHKPQALLRIKNTPPQEGNIRKRTKNVRGAFRVNAEYVKEIQGKNILIIDDVYTTGATIETCSKALKKSGADKIYILTISRVIMPQNMQ